MKVLAFILSLYVVALTLTPCVDRLPDKHAVNNNMTLPCSEQHHQEGADHCSPFCTCNCCATPVIIQDFSVHFECYPFMRRQEFANVSHQVSSPVIAIWEPPKIG